MPARRERLISSIRRLPRSSHLSSENSKASRAYRTQPDQCQQLFEAAGVAHLFGGDLVRDVAHRRGLLAKHLRLRIDVLAVQRKQGLQILGPPQLLRIIEAVRHILFSKILDLFASFSAASMCNLGPPLKSIYRHFGGLHELLKRKLSLFKT